MKSSTELLQYGKEASEDFVKNKIPLDTSIQKLATQHGLNNNEIARVAEEANIKTYLSLIKTAKDNYVEFPLAQTHIKDNTMEKKAHLILDDMYSDILPGSNTEYSMLKVAELKPEDDYKYYDPQIEFIKHAQKLESSIEYSNNVLLEEQISLGNIFDKLAYHSEQHVLQGNPIGEVNTIIKTAATETGEYLVKTIIDNLVNKIGDGFTKTATDKEAFSVNPNSVLYKLANDYNIKAQYLIKIAETCLENINNYNNYIKENKLSGLDKFSNFEKTASAISTAKATMIAVPVGMLANSLVIPKSTTAKEIFLNKDNAFKIMQSARRTTL